MLKASFYFYSILLASIFATTFSKVVPLRSLLTNVLTDSSLAIAYGLTLAATVSSILLFAFALSASTSFGVIDSIILVTVSE
ncbi:MAG: hypothetical protein [Caudoviricetes sp.]|nr:MAG: hypothetical protein [Caudoviricetes sp.]